MCILFTGALATNFTDIVQGAEREREREYIFYFLRKCITYSAYFLGLSQEVLARIVVDPVKLMELVELLDQ